MRIALFTDTYAPQMNGVARTLQRLAAAMTDRSHELRVYAPSHPGERSTDAIRRIPSVPFWAYTELRLASPVVPGLRADLAAWRPDLVHLATPFGVGLAGRAAALALGTPLVTSYHTQLTQYANHYGLGFLADGGMRYLRWFHNSGARTFVPTAAIGAELRARGFERLALWSRGVDAGRFHPGYRDPSLRTAMGAGESSFVVAYVGRVAREKGIDVALDAMREVQRHLPDARLAIAGDGPALRAIRAQAPPGTYFAGRLSGDALSAFYASADVFVFPSTTDTFGNVLLEAMASGLAVVAADVPQAREVVGEHGSFAEPGNARAFAAAVLRYAFSRSKLDEARRSLLVRARECGWSAVWQALLREYHAVCTPQERQRRIPRFDDCADAAHAAHAQHETAVQATTGVR